MVCTIEKDNVDVKLSNKSNRNSFIIKGFFLFRVRIKMNLGTFVFFVKLYAFPG